MSGDPYLKVLLSRLALAQSLGSNTMFDGKRDVYSSCGWPLEITYKQCLHRYKRQGIARRVVNAPVGAAWRGKPTIEERDTPGKDTLFEQDLGRLIHDLRWYYYCASVDRLASIGQYALLFLGLSGQHELKEEVKKSKSNNILYFSAYSQEHATIHSYDEDAKSPRFGLPQTYNIDFGRGGSAGKVFAGKREVHWSRVIHVADEILEGELFGTPKLEPVWNNLLSLEMITGGSAEMYWQGAFPGFGFQAQQDAEFGTEEREQMVEEIENYFHGLQRHLRLRGVDINQLAPQVSDPSNHIDVQVTQISAATGIPKRILTGSERGELSSTQDQENWQDRVDERRKDFLEPVILRPTIDRLIELGAIATPVNGYDVAWPDLQAATEQEMVSLNNTRTSMLTAYVGAPGADVVVPPEVFLRDFLRMDENTIEECLQSIADAQSAPPPEGDEDTDASILDGLDDDLSDTEDDELVTNFLTTLSECRVPGGVSEGGRFVSCDGPGASDWTKQRGGASYDTDNKVWLGEDGAPLSQSEQDKLAQYKIPKAWNEVKLNPDPDGHRVAVGRDSKGRIQSRYSSEFRDGQDADKFNRVAELNDKLPKIRENAWNTFQDQSLSGRERDSAAVVALITETGMRPGSNKDTGADHPGYGATTLEGRHIKSIKGNSVTLEFVGGKAKGKPQTQQFTNKELAGYFKSKNVGPNERVFDVTNRSVADFMKESGGNGFKVKDIRTWKGTSTAVGAIGKMKSPTNKKEFQKSVKQVATTVSDRLGNTPAIALSSYINPEVFSDWQASAGLSSI